MESNQENEEIKEKNEEEEEKNVLSDLEDSVRPASVTFHFDQLKNPPAQFQNNVWFDGHEFWTSRHNFVLNNIDLTGRKVSSLSLLGEQAELKRNVDESKISFTSTTTEVEGVKKEVLKNNDHGNTQGSLSMSQQLSEISNEEEKCKDSLASETGESSVSSLIQQQELLNKQNGSGKKADSLNLHQNNDHDIPEGSFSMSQQTPQIDKGIKGKGLLSNQIRSAEVDEGDKIKEEAQKPEKDVQKQKEEDWYTVGVKYAEIESRTKEWFTQRPAPGKVGSSSKTARIKDKLNELEFGCRYNLIVELLNCKTKGPPGNPIAECQVRDETGTIVFIARGDQALKIMNLETGTKLTLHNAEITIYKKGARRLSVNNETDIKVPEEGTERVDFTVKEDNNADIHVEVEVESTETVDCTVNEDKETDIPVEVQPTDETADSL